MTLSIEPGVSLKKHLWVESQNKSSDIAPLKKKKFLDFNSAIISSESLK